MTAPVYACARCGENPREGDTFLCADCLLDPKRMSETYSAQAGAPDDAREQRRLLVSMAGWAGWSKRIKGGSRA